MYGVCSKGEEVSHSIASGCSLVTIRGALEMVKSVKNINVGGVWVQEIKVKKGDCLWKIMKARGYDPKYWRKYYDAPFNKAFKKSHPNPDLIYANDIFRIPSSANFYMKKAMQKELRGKISQLKKHATWIRKHSEEAKKQGVKAIREAKQTRDLGDFLQALIGLITGLNNSAIAAEKALVDVLAQLFKSTGQLAASKGHAKLAESLWIAKPADFYIKYNSPNHWGQFIGQLIKGKGVIDAWTFNFDKAEKEVVNGFDTFSKDVDAHVGEMITELEAQVKALD